MYKLHTFLLCISAFFFVHANLHGSSLRKYERNFIYDSNANNNLIQDFIRHKQINYVYDELSQTSDHSNTYFLNHTQNEPASLSQDAPLKSFPLSQLTYDDQDHLHTSQTISHIYDTSGASLQIYLSSTRPGSAAGDLADEICFVAGTQVKTDAGFKNIEDVEVGDKVWSKSDKTGEEGFKPVVTLFETKPTQLVHLTYRNRESKSARVSNSSDDDDSDSNTLIGTKEHPFWSVDRKEWVPMGELKEGEVLLLSGGSEALVEAKVFEDAKDGQTFTTYNFEVADWHTYFVAPANAREGQSSVWVHNKGLLCGDGIYRATAAYEKYGMKYITRLKRQGKINATDIRRITAQRQMNILTRRAAKDVKSTMVGISERQQEWMHIPFLNRMFTGTAIEKHVANQISNSRRLQGLFEWTGSARSTSSIGYVSKILGVRKGGFVDFVGQGRNAGMIFDITGKASRATKYRKYGSDILVPTY